MPYMQYKLNFTSKTLQIVLKMYSNIWSSLYIIEHLHWIAQSTDIFTILDNTICADLNNSVFIIY